jgi:hypothetical protein
VSPKYQRFLHRLLIDVQYFIRTLSAIDGLEGPGSHLEVVVNSINIKERKAGGVGLNPGLGRGFPERKKSESKVPSAATAFARKEESNLSDKPKTATSKFGDALDPVGSSASDAAANLTAKASMMTKMIFNKSK